ncbi:hypothetical protein GCM10009001_00600 [Virgibacillus siamensis]|uniref:DUF975 family protein n=1 Tax=Virgibacillus siamensis TaxID=480071 RepID=A0ABN1FDI0_9BACI
MIKILDSLLYSIKEGGSLYINNIEKIFVIGVIYMFPIQFLMVLGVFSISFLFPLTLQDEVKIFFTLFAVIISQIPYIYYFRFFKYKDEIPELKKVLGSIYRFFSPVYMYAVYYSLLVTLGYHFYLIPGLVIGILFYSYPFYLIINNGSNYSLKINLKRTLSFGYDRFAKLFTIICFVIFIEVTSWFVLLNIFHILSSKLSLFTLTFSRIVLDLLLFPFLIFIICSYFYKHN